MALRSAAAAAASASRPMDRRRILSSAPPPGRSLRTVSISISSSSSDATRQRARSVQFFPAAYLHPLAAAAAAAAADSAAASRPTTTCSVVPGACAGQRRCVAGGAVHGMGGSASACVRVHSSSSAVVNLHTHTPMQRPKLARRTLPLQRQQLIADRARPLTTAASAWGEPPPTPPPPPPPPRSVAATSLYDASPDWADWFSADEYADVYSDSSAGDGNGGGGGGGGLDPLLCPELDNSTRYLAALLDDVRVGIRRGVDRPTTARCNRALERLSDMSLGGKKLVGRSQRADAIFRRMARFREVEEGRRQHRQRYGQQNLKFELPLPDRDTYRLVLRLFASTAGPDSVARRAEAILTDMKHEYAARGNLTLRPDVRFWNEVISCWAVSDHHDKAYHAAAILGSAKDEGLADASSYTHVLRACALSGFDDRSRRLAAEVGLRVWRDYDRSKVPPSPHVYAYILQVLRFLPEGTRRDRDVERAFVDCCRDGLVNAHVVHRLGQVASEGLCRKLLGEELSAKARAADSKEIQGMMVPVEWTKNANAEGLWGLWYTN